jgi:HSP20 family molecular chaperone IbpA
MITLYNTRPLTKTNVGEPLLGQLWNPQPLYRTSRQLRLIKSEDGYFIQAPVPGIEKDAIDITVNDKNRTITIKGDAAHANYEYIASVPPALDMSSAEAIFNNGMIEIQFPMLVSEDEERKLELTVRGS